MENLTRKFYRENEKSLMEFGDFFISKLCDRELMENLANKDPEKLARIFRLVLTDWKKRKGKRKIRRLKL